MTPFAHPFNDSLRKIEDRLDMILKNQKIENLKEHNYYLLDNFEIQKLFKISSRTARNWREEGILPYAHIKGKIYYKLSDVKKIIDENYVNNRKR